MPRLLFSAADALFTARFVLLLHSLEAKFFSTVLALDAVSPRARCPHRRCTLPIQKESASLIAAHRRLPSAPPSALRVPQA